MTVFYLPLVVFFILSKIKHHFDKLFLLCCGKNPSQATTRVKQYLYKKCMLGRWLGTEDNGERWRSQRTVRELETLLCRECCRIVTRFSLWQRFL